MGLVNKLKMTEKKLAANRRNQKLGHEQQTAQGLRRNRDAHLRHGTYAQQEEIALTSLGEVPEEYQSLRDELWMDLNPIGRMEEELVDQLAFSTQQLRRTDRMQEGLSLRLARDASLGRSNHLRASMIRIKGAELTLRTLLSHLQRDHFVTLPQHLQWLKNVGSEPVLKEMAEVMYGALEELQPPGAEKDSPEEQQRKVLKQIKDIFGISEDCNPDYQKPAGEGAPPEAGTEGGAEPVPWWRQKYPTITDRQWEVWERCRQWLENMTNRLISICDQHHQHLLKLEVAGPSIYERAAELAPGNRDTLTVRRLADSHFREVRRITTLLLKVQKARQKREGAKNDAKSAAGKAGEAEVRHDVIDKKEVKSDADKSPEAASS